MFVLVSELVASSTKADEIDIIRAIQDWLTQSKTRFSRAVGGATILGT